MRTICIYHRIDLDGWMSAAVVKHWHMNKHSEAQCVDFKDYQKDNRIALGDAIVMLGWNYGDTIPDLSEYDKVIMCDVSFPKEEMDKLHWKLRENFIWLDHHISAINDAKGYSYLRCEGLRLTCFAACELTWIYFMEGISYNPGEGYFDYDMPEIVRLLGMYDSFRHKQTDEEQTVLEFQYGARSCISNYEEAYYYLEQEIIRNEGDVSVPTPSTWEYILDQGIGIYRYLCTEAKQTYKNGFEILLVESKNDATVGEQVKKFICFNKGRFNPINFGIEYHKDGYDGAACFWYDGKQWTFSIYNDNGEVDCSVIAKGLGGGGHRGASGFKVDDINNFLNNVRN